MPDKLWAVSIKRHVITRITVSAKTRDEANEIAPVILHKLIADDPVITETEIYDGRVLKSKTVEITPPASIEELADEYNDVMDNEAEALREETV